NQMFQYFITVVPTKLHTSKISAETHQFSVTERERVINHAAGSHGVSGIFMKYDISSLMVTVTEEHMPFWQFLVRLCGIVGGIFSTTEDGSRGAFRWFLLQRGRNTRRNDGQRWGQLILRTCLCHHLSPNGIGSDGRSGTAVFEAPWDDRRP
ncbi:UNVERIFIED_CONTAM: hypothetical protein K2H54_057307, partial [Gekko kuhli]